MLFAFTMLMGAANVMDRPARFTTAFELVPRELAVKAVALNTIGFSHGARARPDARGLSHRRVRRRRHVLPAGRAVRRLGR